MMMMIDPVKGGRGCCRALTSVLIVEQSMMIIEVGIVGCIGE